MNDHLKIAGVSVANPAEDGIKITDEPVWADGAGRNVSTGEMIATLVCWKRQVEITWNKLTFNEALTILNAIKAGGSFFDIQYNDVDQTSHSGDTYTQIRVYTSSLPRTISTLESPGDNNKKRIKDVTITFTEK